MNKVKKPVTYSGITIALIEIFFFIKCLRKSSQIILTCVMFLKWNIIG